MKKFIEIVGNASSTASYKGKIIGHNVNVCAYATDKGIELVVESNASRVNHIPAVTLSEAQYAELCEKQPRPLFARALCLMGCETDF